MTKQQIAAALTSATGGEAFASVNQLSKALRIDSRTFMRLMDGVEYWRTGRSNRFLISDVAARIYAHRESNGFML
jgi:hypothetical protein